MEADNKSDISSAADDGMHYCSVTGHEVDYPPFDGDKRLKEFIENVNVAFELVDPRTHGILLKFLKAKITGDARSKLMVTDLARCEPC
jgi:hypothetical protein